MSSKITKARAFTNGEVAYISWQLDGMIHGCLGFEITRKYPDTPADNTVLPAWVPFKGQSNPEWKPQNTSVWPVQKLSWRDLTLRKRRDRFDLRPENVKVLYLIRPIVAYKSDLEEVHSAIPVTYTGKKVRLSYLDEGATTNEFFVGIQYGDIRATFTNGILAAQWLTHALKEAGQTFKDVRDDIKDPKNKIRKYLTGDVLNTLKLLLEKASANPNSTLRMALYELDDAELFDTLLANKNKIEIILSNTSKDKKGNWDSENSSNREKLKQEGVKIHDRMFNNTRIGHNKFVIYLEDDKPKSVMTGSTNWTSNGLCAQSNNAVIIDSPEISTYYNDYWELLKTDTENFVTPEPLSISSKNAQGSALRSSDATGTMPITLNDGTTITVWFSPNTMRKTTDKTNIPPDLSHVYSLMRKAEKAIFFAVFLPGRSNDNTGSEIMTNIITEAIALGEKDNSLMIYGAISDPTAMPNYVNPHKKTDTADDTADEVTPEKKPTPTTYDKGKTHIVRAYNLNQSDLVGEFESELLSAGHAIIHDKIVVIDPFSKNGAVIFGSHNLGFKASYENDENLLIIQNNQALVEAYAVHVLDIYEHYRFRAIQQELQDQGKAEWDGYLSISDGWLEKNIEAGGKSDLSDYMCE